MPSIKSAAAPMAIFTALCLAFPVLDADVESLYQAAERGDIEDIEALVEAGAEPDVKLKTTGWTPPLHRAASEGHTEAVKLLLAASADVNARDDFGRVPLHLAASEGHTEAVKLLLAASADVNARDDFGRVPLHLAAGGAISRPSRSCLKLAPT